MSALDRLKLLGGRWIKVGRFEVNTSTGERRPIPGLELGALPEDVDKEESPWSLGTVGRDLAQGVANIPGVAAEGALFLSNNMPQNLLATYLSGKALEAMGEGSYEELRQGQQEFRNDLLDPYRRAKEGIAPPVPSFTEDPIQSTIRNSAQALPQTLALLATGGTGYALSGAQMADQSYQEMKERGVPDYLALPASSAVGIGQGSLDKIGAEGAFKGITGNVLGRMAKGAALEGLTETAQEGIGIAGESLTGKDQDYNLVKERLATALSGGMLMGGMLGGAPRVQGINAPNLETPPAQAIEERIYPKRRALDYAKLAVTEDPAYAASTALVDAGMAISPRKKREMILDKQTELALKTEWDGAKDRINADPEAAVIRLDLDGVKAGNDTLGHDVADQQIFRPMSDAVHAIAEEYGIGERLRFRAGGDEFILVVPKSQAPEISERLKELTAPRFVPAPPDKALEAGIPPGEAFVQYGASVGWGMDDHSADQEVYKIKASKPERGKLVRREQAEQQVIDNIAPQQPIAPPAAQDPAPSSPAPPLSSREVLAGSGAIMAVPVDQINAAVNGARSFLNKAMDVRQKYFTAEGNLPIPWMQAHEGQVQGQRAAKLAVDYIVKDYGKALEQEIKNGSLPEEINHRAKQYLSGDKEVAIPEPMKPVLDRMRAYYDNEISQRLIDSGVARDPAHVKTILENQGEYIFRAFKMHTEPDWSEKMVGTPTFERAVDYLLTNEDQRLQKMVDSRNQLAQEYEAKLAEVQEQINSMQMDMGRIDVLEQDDLETLHQMESTFNAPGALRSVSKQLIEEARQERIAAKKKIRETRKAQLAALQQEYGRKLGSARRHATWAEKKIAENAANQDRRAQAAGKVEGLITYDPKPVHPGGFKGLSKAWLSKRKNIPQPLLDVMGEIDDPATGLVVVAERAARSIGRKEMWQQIAEGSLGRDVFTQEMPGHVHKIEGVRIPGPDGKDVELYTSKELHDAISEAFDEGHQAAGFFDLFNGGLKANATIFNPQGAMRNLESGIVPLVANHGVGVIPGLARYGISSARIAAANAGWGNKQWRQEAVEATRYGILGTNVDTRDIADYLRPITEGEGKSIPKQMFDFAQKAYAWGDNFAKLMSWKMERDRYAEAYGLPRDSPEVMARAAEVVKRTIQNYDRLPKWAKEVRKSPVIGPFVSFPASVLSNTAGIYNTIREDIASPDPKVKKAGYKRAAYALGTLGGIAFGESIARLFKDEEEDDNEVLDKARELLPPWMKNSALLLWDKSPGKVRTIDVSFLNYYDTVTRPIQMLLRGDLANEPGDVMLSTAWEMAKKIFGEELALQAYADLTRGPLSGGPEVVNEEMQPDVALWRVGRYALRSMAPGAIRSAARILEAEPGKRGTEIAALAGPRITTLNVPRSLDYSLYELQNDRTAIRTSLQGALKSTALLAMPEFQSNVQGFKPSMESIYSQALTKYRSAIDLGVSPNEARASMGDKMYKSGKLLISFVNLGATPEVAVKKVVEREWEGLKPDLLQAVREKQKLSLKEYVSDHPTATALEIERRRLDLEKWGREATAIINGQQQETALDRLRKLGAN